VYKREREREREKNREKIKFFIIILEKKELPQKKKYPANREQGWGALLLC
jgi:hypothetical protein